MQIKIINHFIAKYLSVAPNDIFSANHHILDNKRKNKYISYKKKKTYEDNSLMKAEGDSFLSFDQIFSPTSLKPLFVFDPCTKLSTKGNVHHKM